jgi:signal recognition particle receptor subunit beta
VVVVSYSGKEINAKLVYYGAGLSGKTTNLEAIYEAVPDTSRGKMVSMKTQSDRTLFFDLLPLDLGEIMGFKTRFLLYTVPGQVFYNATRKLVLKGADAIVFVADSEVGKMEENKESLANLKTNLAEYGLSLDETPWVIQYNKRDLPNVYSVEELDAELNEGGKVPSFEAVAPTGKGVFETFRGVSHLLMETCAARRSRARPRARSRGAWRLKRRRNPPAARLRRPWRPSGPSRARSRRPSPARATVWRASSTGARSRSRARSRRCRRSLPPPTSPSPTVARVLRPPPPTRRLRRSLPPPWLRRQWSSPRKPRRSSPASSLCRSRSPAALRR